MVLSKCSRRQITPCYGREEVDSIQLLLTKVNKYEEEEEKKSGSRPRIGPLKYHDSFCQASEIELLRILSYSLCQSVGFVDRVVVMFDRVSTDQV